MHLADCTHCNSIILCVYIHRPVLYCTKAAYHTVCRQLTLTGLYKGIGFNKAARIKKHCYAFSGCGLTRAVLFFYFFFATAG